MKLLEFPLRRYQFTVIAFLCLIALGCFAFSSIPREEDPYFKRAAFSFTVIYPGADPKDVERLVAKPIEDRLSTLDDVKKIEITIVDGVAFIAVEFEAHANADQKYDDVTREINALRPELPADIVRLEIRKWNPGSVNVLQLALLSEDAPYRELEDCARDLKDVLQAVPGISTAETWAYPSRELRIAVDTARMAELKITVPQVVAALESENANIPAGSIDVGVRSFSLQTSRSYTTLDQVRETTVSSANGQSVRVRDIAAVSWDNAPLTYIGRYNGKRAVFVTATQKDGQNILATRKRVGAALEAFKQTLPGRIRLGWSFDQSKNVARRLSRLYKDLGVAVALIAVTLLPLGLRAAGIVMITVPLSLAAGLTVLFFAGYSLNQLSIAGFVIALGLLVDDSIVVVENIARHLREGQNRMQAAISGTRQIFAAIAGCTATLVFAFVPLLALPGVSGKFIRALPVSIIATIVGSLFIALLLIPFLASRVLKESENPHGNIILQRLMSLVHRYYNPALQFCLRRPRGTAIVAMGCTLLLIPVLVSILGRSLFPKADTPQFLIDIESPDGASLAETDRALRFVEGKLAAMPEVAGYYSNLGHGNPRIYYNHIPRQDDASFAEIFVQLKGYDTRGTPRMLDALRSSLDRYPNARVYIKEFVNGPPISAPIAVRIIGNDLDRLQQLSRQIEGVLKATPGTRDVDNPLRVYRTNLRLDFNSGKANLLGVPTIELERAVRLAVSGVPAGKFKDTNGEQYDIVVRAPVGDRANDDSLAMVRIPTVNGGSLPLAQLAELRFERAPTLVQRYNRERSATINAQVERGSNTGKVTSEVKRRLDTFAWPRGYRYTLGGEAESSTESFGGIGTAVIVTVFGIFAILVLEFGSFKSTLIVLTVVPLGVIGGLLMLVVSGNDISFTASLGFVGLIGIEIKNSILLVDFTNQLRRTGVSLDFAIERAGEVRFLPILLTSATAIGGLLPLALENSGLYSPMAWVVIGGLITSTLLARLVTPVMYKLLTPELAVDQ